MFIMNKLNGHTKRVVGVVSIIMLVVFFAFAVYVESYYFLKLKEKETSPSDLMSGRIKSVVSEINTIPKSIGSDLSFLASISSIDDFRESEGNLSDEIKDDFMNFMDGSEAYYMLKYIINDSCKICIEKNLENGNYNVFYDEELDWKEKSFAKKAGDNLSNGYILISDLELSSSDNRLEKIKRNGDDEYVPIMRYASLVHDKNGEVNGVLVLVVWADYFLEDIRNSNRDGERVFLINEDGYYLASSEHVEFGDEVGDVNSNFKRDFPDAYESIFDENIKTYKNEDYVFNYERIYPYLSSFKINNGVGDSNFYWILVSVSEKEEFDSFFYTQKKEYMYSLSLLCVLFVLTFLLFLSHFVWSKNR